MAMADDDVDQAPYPPESIRRDDNRRIGAARCCFGRFSSKIGAFVLTSFWAHQIALAMIYTFHNHDWQSPSNLPLTPIRLFQLLTVAICYIGLWRHKCYYLVPFIVFQLTLGSYADLTTWMLLVKAHSQKDTVPPVYFSTPLIYLVLPILIYAAFCVFFTYVMYKCYAFFKAKHSTSTRPPETQDLTELETF